MPNKLFLLDGMALAYRAHFALIRSPITTSKGVNTSAIFGFVNALLDILKTQNPTHLAVAFDTAAPTQRHEEYPAYKAQREAMPEDLSTALPQLRRVLEAFRIPVIELDGYEADDLIGTLAAQAEAEGFETWMVTPDKDFGQLVSTHTRIYKPGRQGGEMEILGPEEVCNRWGIQRVDQVKDILGLMGDASDNIPGVPGIGEKTAAKLIAQFDSVDGVLAALDQLPAKQAEKLREHAENARLSKRLATIQCDVPITVPLESLLRQSPDEAVLKPLFVELEFNTLGKRVFGEEFKAGRGHATMQDEDDLFAAPAAPVFKTIEQTAHQYALVETEAEFAKFLAELNRQTSFCFDLETTGLDPRESEIVGVAFSFSPHTAHYVVIPSGDSVRLEVLRSILENSAVEKTGHNLKFDMLMLAYNDICVAGKLFDTMLAHALVEPEKRHGMDLLSETYLGYAPIPISRLIGEKKSEQRSMRDVPLTEIAEYAGEDADVTLQLRAKIEPLLAAQGMERVFHEVECPLLPALVAMEMAGVSVDSAALAAFSITLGAQIARDEKRILELAGTAFNLNSPKQLGQVLFDILKLAEKPKKTKTGQYVTDEQVLQTLAGKHEIVRTILEYREAMKLKSTYVDALPASISPRTSRIHTTFMQATTATGRMASQNPNLQNIPIRSDLGREIRRAFVSGIPGFPLLSADYSQIELRIMAELSEDQGMRDAFAQGRDIHTETAARVYGVETGSVDDEMRRRAKMVNFGIIYGISPFGLAQRLAIPREEASTIIDHYFTTFPGVRRYMDETIEFARTHGYVQTLTGRRRPLRDIGSANATVRQAAERTAINTPIQGTAADMIKIAMARIHALLIEGNCRTRMLLQVHDELLFELDPAEGENVIPKIVQTMAEAIPMKVPILVETGIGANWLEAH